MAIIKNGILGAFSGNIGNIVGLHSGGQDQMRLAPKQRTTPATVPEKANQDKFAYAQSWLKPLTPFLRVGFQGYRPTFQGFTAAKSYNLLNAFIGFAPYFQIDPSKALVSHGDMSQATYATATAEEDNYLTFRWSGGDFEYSDRAMLVAYDITGELASFNTCSERADGGYAKLRLAGDLRGKHLDVYLAFVSEDRKRRSNSQYLGLVKAM